MFWPIQGMPIWMQKVAEIFVLNLLPIESLTNIILKNHDITKFSVLKGYISITIWIFILMISTHLVLKKKKIISRN